MPSERRRAPAPTALVTRDLFTVTVGTAVWAVLLAVAVAFESTLRRDHHLWWLATAAVGAGLGFAGMAFLARRQRRRNSSTASSATSGRPAP